jgi:hypothetical protein
MGKFRGWLPVFLYTAGVFIVTPFLPDLIRAASSRWSSPGVSHFVLRAELFLAALVLAFSGFLLLRRKKRSIFLVLSFSGVFFLSFFIYQYLPNPYEFTHLPEYAILGMLVIKALERKDRRKADLIRNSKESIKRVGGVECGEENKVRANRITGMLVRNPYFLGGFITGIIGTVDEIYQYFLPNRSFTWYDIFLNALGGILGLLVFWGAKR